MAPNQLLGSRVIKEKTPFPKASLISFLQTNPATQVGLLQNSSWTFFNLKPPCWPEAVTSTLYGLLLKPQTSEVSGRCLVKILSKLSIQLPSTPFSKWIM